MLSLVEDCLPQNQERVFEDAYSGESEDEKGGKCTDESDYFADSGYENCPHHTECEPRHCLDVVSVGK